jgi:hypothetical protein
MLLQLYANFGKNASNWPGETLEIVNFGQNAVLAVTT